MPKPELNTIPEFYHKYVKLVTEESAVDALTASTPLMLTLFQEIPEQAWGHRYAEGKWSIKELVQHMIDTERIFSYRALCFSRGEKGSLPGFDENTYAAWSDADRRNKEDLIREFSAVREATLLLFRSFTEDQLNRTGIANNNPVSVNGIGFITAGHMLHHLDILQDRYLS
jgi:uncharacterized damage-inducible protein DinB